MKNIESDLLLDEVVDTLLEIGIERFEGKQKKAWIMLKSAKKLMSAALDCTNKYTSLEMIESCSEEELEYVHHFFEALCEAIEDFQKDVVPVKKVIT